MDGGMTLGGEPQGGQIHTHEHTVPTLPMPPMEGLQLISPTVSIFCVTRTVLAPVRALAAAASQPAWPLLVLVFIVRVRSQSDTTTRISRPSCLVLPC